MSSAAHSLQPNEKKEPDLGSEFGSGIFTLNFHCGLSCSLTTLGQNAQSENAFDTILELFKMLKCG